MEQGGSDPLSSLRQSRMVGVVRNVRVRWKGGMFCIHSRSSECKNCQPFQSQSPAFPEAPQEPAGEVTEQVKLFAMPEPVSRLERNIPHVQDIPTRGNRRAGPVSGQTTMDL